MMNIHASIELFHLLFLRQLEGKLDKKLYALKGGCNLRFYFKSIRYSEDIDFDIATISKQTLEKKITKILSSIDFKRILQNKEIEIIQTNPAKQTDTTQRWKLLLRIKNSTAPIPTKIEFSRRKLDSGIEYVPIDKDVLSQYSLYPIICNHYDRKSAVIQKINALIHRTETQARDIFDLKWLFEKEVNIDSSVFSLHEVQTAIKNMDSITFSDFKGHVLAYLMDEYKQYYDEEQKWIAICEEVKSRLEKLIDATH